MTSEDYLESNNSEMFRRKVAKHEDSTRVLPILRFVTDILGYRCNKRECKRAQKKNISSRKSIKINFPTNRSIIAVDLRGQPSSTQQATFTDYTTRYLYRRRVDRHENARSNSRPNYSGRRFNRNFEKSFLVGKRKLSKRSKRIRIPSKVCSTFSPINIYSKIE